MRTALARGKPDRVPIAFIGDPDFYAKAAGRPLWELEYGDNEAVTQIKRDAFLRFPHNDYLHVRGHTRNRVASRRLVMVDGKPYVEHTCTGDLTAIRPRKTATYWGEPGHQEPTSRGWDPPVRSEADFAWALGPKPTPDELLASGEFEPMIALRRYFGDDAYMTAGIGAWIYSSALAMMGGFECGLVALHERPGVFRALVEQLAERHCVHLEASASIGADAALLGAELQGADIISPQAWREVVLPGHRVLVERAHSLGLQVLLWFLGDCMPLLDDLVELGVDGLWLEQDRRGYCADPVAVRKRVENEICVWGWNWELDLINDDRGSITRNVERQIRGAGADGAFIMGTTYLTSEAHLEALDHYCAEVLRVSREVGY
jgi:hypothetical protein